MLSKANQKTARAQSSEFNAFEHDDDDDNDDNFLYNHLSIYHLNPADESDDSLSDSYYHNNYKCDKSHASLEELMAGRVQPSPNERPEEKEKHISAFWFMVEFMAPKGLWHKRMGGDMCSIPLQQTNFMASDETMTKLALENMWQQWHAAP
jgi:hypothetical protein